MFSYSRFMHHSEISLDTYVEPISKDFRVFINGEEIPVYTCRISAYPFNCWWKGHQRQIDQTELASFVNLVSDESVNVEIIAQKPHQRVLIKPYSKQIVHEERNGRICFALKPKDTCVVELDDYHGCLFIFNDTPIPCEDPGKVTHYFGPGVHMVGKMILQDGDSVYLDKDALVFGCVFAKNAKNIRIYGNGLMDDSAEERIDENCYAEYNNGNLKFYDCQNIRVEGVLFRNSAIWCVNLFHCFDVLLDGIKVFGQWRYNTDGIDIVNSQDVTVQNSFVHSFDDTVTIKGIDRYIDTDCKRITVDKCILWCDWGRPCEIGLETACREYSDIVFRNCDVIRPAAVALDIQHGDCAEIHHIRFENIRAEFEAFYTREEIQREENDVYTRQNVYAGSALISINNKRFRQQYAFLPGMKEMGESYGVDLEGIKSAGVHDILYKDIAVYYDPRIPNRDGKLDLRILVQAKHVEGACCENIVIDGITVNGAPLTREDSLILSDTPDAICFIEK